jgi:hypothetical protein
VSRTAVNGPTAGITIEINPQIAELSEFFTGIGQQQTAFNKNAALIAQAVFIFIYAKQAMPDEPLILLSTVKCPACNNTEKLLMPRYATKTFYECGTCRAHYHVKKHECCVFCSLGDITCPPTQARRASEQINYRRN